MGKRILWSSPDNGQTGCQWARKRRRLVQMMDKQVLDGQENFVVSPRCSLDLFVIRFPRLYNMHGYRVVPPATIRFFSCYNTWGQLCLILPPFITRRPRPAAPC
ncbi:hypothetical protein BaRGS_00039786 [Batillaria attramentaria]|uniref:Uncharacterized protein n=1 Tax=Batillaria attramentaria TaxID=370345 RepID=A0ABD0J288_9CAEN